MKLKEFWQVLDELYEGVIFVDAANRVSFWNKSASRITGFTAEEAKGRYCCEDMLNHLDFMGHEFENCPLRQTLADGQAREAQLFLRHKAGHRLSVNARTHPLRAEDGRVVGAVEILLDRTCRADILTDLEERRGESYTDLITGAGNRSFAELNLASRLRELTEQNLSCGIILIRVCGFQALLEDYGRAVAERGLKIAADTLAGALRQHDVLARWGGEDFVVITPGVDATSLANIAGRLSRLLAQSCIVVGTGVIVALTASIGASLARPDDQPASLVARCANLLSKSPGCINITTDEALQPPEQA